MISYAILKWKLFVLPRIWNVQQNWKCDDRVCTSTSNCLRIPSAARVDWAFTVRSIIPRLAGTIGKNTDLACPAGTCPHEYIDHSKHAYTPMIFNSRLLSVISKFLNYFSNIIYLFSKCTFILNKSTFSKFNLCTIFFSTTLNWSLDIYTSYRKLCTYFGQNIWLSIKGIRNIKFIIKPYLRWFKNGKYT